jgi:nucleoside-diphosphate-sugar epimerase
MNRGHLLLTGATGFIGSHLADKLLAERTWPIVAIVRRANGYKNTAHLEQHGATLVAGNFYDAPLLNAVFTQYPIDYVIHAAALRGIGAGTRDDYLKLNVEGTEHLLGAALRHGVKKFIFCSTVGVFGTVPGEVPAGFTTAFNGDNAYHRSKILAEGRVQEYISRGLNAFIVRPPITYGTGDNGFPASLVRMASKRMLLLPRPDVRIHLLDVRVLADLFTAIIKQPDPLPRRVFCVADAAPIMLSELINLIHHFFYRTPYPSMLRVPRGLLRLLHLACGRLTSEKWSARLQLLYRNWYYDTGDTCSLLGIKAVDTPAGFLAYLAARHA